MCEIKLIDVGVKRTNNKTNNKTNKINKVNRISKTDVVNKNHTKVIIFEEDENIKICMHCGEVFHCNPKYCSCSSTKFLDYEVAKKIGGYLNLIKRHKLIRYVRQNAHYVNIDLNLDCDDIIYQLVSKYGVKRELVRKIYYNVFYKRRDICPVCKGMRITKNNKICEGCNGRGTWYSYIKNNQGHIFNEYMTNKNKR